MKALGKSFSEFFDEQGGFAVIFEARRQVVEADDVVVEVICFLL